ncbi:MAG: flagellar biosynthesis protein FlhB [Nitrospirae bacterium]|nr:flagellar biosynthesis protein FlhB [Nitrospirota bacterium]NTW67250.1 flagellar biosynthesis protein FlhB [Nitrospirota bacterium]
MTDKSNKAAALKYRAGMDSAPTLVAKGRGLVADKIIALAKEQGIPVHEDRNMVEILSSLSLYEEIPPDLYKAVAEILAFIYKMTGKV